MSTPPVLSTTPRTQNVKGRIPRSPPPRVSSVKEESPQDSIGYSHLTLPRPRLPAVSGSPSTWPPLFPDFRPSSSPSNISCGPYQELPSSPVTDQPYQELPSSPVSGQPSRSSNVPSRSPPRLESFEQIEPTDSLYTLVLPKSERPKKPNSRGIIPPSPPPRISSLNRRASTTSDGYPIGTPPPLPPPLAIPEGVQDLSASAPLRLSRGRLPRKADKERPMTARGSKHNYTYSEMLGFERWVSNGSSMASGMIRDSYRNSGHYEPIQEMAESTQSPSIRTASPSPAQRPVSELRSDASEIDKDLNPYAKPGPADPYVGSNIVVGLTKDTFKSFIKDLDAAFVLFYDPGNKDCSWAKLNMREAALVTQRDKHVYAAVNCTKDRKLCRSEGVKSMPTMKLYTRGKSLATYDEDTILSSSQMTSFVENTPVLSQSIFTKLNCFGK